MYSRRGPSQDRESGTRQTINDSWQPSEESHNQSTLNPLDIEKITTCIMYNEIGNELKSGVLAPGALRMRIGLGVPEWQPFYQVMNNEPADATYVIQGNLSRGLLSRGHELAFIAPSDLDYVVYTRDPQQPSLAARTWSDKKWFIAVSKGAWKIQQLLGIPYLNIFSNFQF